MVVEAKGRHGERAGVEFIKGRGREGSWGMSGKDIGRRAYGFYWEVE